MSEREAKARRTARAEQAQLTQQTNKLPTSQTPIKNPSTNPKGVAGECLKKQVAILNLDPS